MRVYEYNMKLFHRRRVLTNQWTAFWEGPVLLLGRLKLETLYLLKLLWCYRHLESARHLNSHVKLPACGERATERGIILSANTTLLS